MKSVALVFAFVGLLAVSVQASPTGLADVQEIRQSQVVLLEQHESQYRKGFMSTADYLIEVEAMLKHLGGVVNAVEASSTRGVPDSELEFIEIVETEAHLAQLKAYQAYLISQLAPNTGPTSFATR